MADKDVQNPPVQPIPTPVTWGPPGLNSSFSNQGIPWPVPPNASDVNDILGCYWDVPNQVTISAGASFSIPPYKGYLITGSSVNSAVLQIQQGTLGAWVTIRNLNANDAFWYRSDWGNTRILNGISGSTVITFVVTRNQQ